jgi:hypothetical protein
LTVGAVLGVGIENTELVGELDTDSVPDCLLKKSPTTLNGAQSSKEASIYFMMVWEMLHDPARIQHRAAWKCTS